MKINNVEFITSFADSKVYALGEYPPEICMAGRSNVGKSTFINMLTGRKIAKTSSTPGRTRLINIFSINGGEFNLVDLPGYGYAAAAKSEKDKWQSMAGGYFQVSKSLKQVFVIVDSRVDSPLDKQMIDYLYYYRLPFTVLVSKCDKLPTSKLAARLSQIAAFFKLGKDDVIPISMTGRGKDAVLSRINSILYPQDIGFTEDADFFEETNSDEANFEKIEAVPDEE